jgi:Cyclic nucleotide-binding domain
MRHISSVTSVSWIPSEAVEGLSKPIFELGVTHYDDPPPDQIDDLAAWRSSDRFRFANHLAAWIEVVDGAIVDGGYAEDSGGSMGATTVRLGPGDATFAAVGLDDIRQPPEAVDGGMRFVQTVGGRTAVPAPRHVKRPPFVRLQAPVVWTTLALTLRVDGTASFEVAGASPFPRHWVYDADGALAAKVGVADFRGWYHGEQGHHTPWGDEDTPALVTAVETALERELSTQIMRSGAKPKTLTLKAGAALTTQGAEGDELFLLLDGVLAVEVDDQVVAEVGPGAVVGERAVLEGGLRTSTLRALTPVRVAAASADQIEPEVLAGLASGHRRESLGAGRPGAAPAS